MCEGVELTVHVNVHPFIHSIHIESSKISDAVVDLSPKTDKYSKSSACLLKSNQANFLLLTEQIESVTGLSRSHKSRKVTAVIKTTRVLSQIRDRIFEKEEVEVWQR